MCVLRSIEEFKLSKSTINTLVFRHWNSGFLNLFCTYPYFFDQIKHIFMYYVISVRCLQTFSNIFIYLFLMENI